MLVFCNVSEMRSVIEATGIEVIDWSLDRRSKNPLRELTSVIRLRRCIQQLQPDIIHAVALKPVIYSFIGLKSLRSKIRMIAALGGLGFIYSSSHRSAAILRPIITKFFIALLKRPHTQIVLQNPDDAKLLTDAGLPSRTGNPAIIRGVGVRTNTYKPHPEPANVPLRIILPGRMLWDKGIAEFVEVAKRIAITHPEVEFVLIGKRDEHNPECVALAQLKIWQDQGIVKWLGHQTDMPSTLQSAAIVLFPSYREGFPKALLEAASSEIPIVAFDVPGCREIVKHEHNGFLVPFADIDALTLRTQQLIEDSHLRARFGKAGRQAVIERFSVTQIAKETLDVWEHKIP